MTGGEPAEDGLLVVIDPLWTATADEPEPPSSAIVGGWAHVDDELGERFQANPGYRPSSPDSPLDPVDDVLRRLAFDPGAADDLPMVLRTTMLGIAVDQQGVALVRPAPDGFSAVLVATSPGHRERATAPAWLDVAVEELAAALPATGVDVLLNPGALTSMRVHADGIREIADGRQP